MSEADTTPLTPPDDILGSSDMRVQEWMYGHRFTTDQEPYMILLETLTICAEKPLGSANVDGIDHETMPYGSLQRRKMRHLVFADRNLERISKDDRIPDNKKWDAWKAAANADFQKSLKGQNGLPNHFGYLDDQFDRNVHALLQAVRILRSQELDVINQRRWTSRFLAIKGPDMVCDDIREGSKDRDRDWSRDRRFFARGGELVYLMLNRSSRVQELRDLIEKKLLNSQNTMNRIARALSDTENDHKSGDAEIGYLPLKCHPIYSQIADDWFNILSIDKLPYSHMFDPLFRVTGINLVRYFAQRNAKILEEKNVEPIVADAQNGFDIPLRDSARDHFNRYRTTANRAVDEFIRKSVEKAGWDTAMSQKSYGDVNEIIERTFLRKRDKKTPEWQANILDERVEPEQRLRRMIKVAQDRGKNNISTFLLPLTKGIGLVTARPGAGTWFALDDAMITALVLSNVNDTNAMELREFVRLLYERYGLVIGPDEARIAFGEPPVGIERFRNNLAALENRMTRLALTRRLSDDCAFAVNPYR